MRRKHYEEGEKQFPKQYNINEHRGGSVIAWACMATRRTGSLVFIEDVIVDGSSKVNSEVYRALLSAQIIRQCFTVQIDNDSKHTAKATQEVCRS